MAGLELVVVGAEMVELVESGVVGAGPVLLVVDLEPGLSIAATTQHSGASHCSAVR